MKPHIRWFSQLSCWICLDCRNSVRGYLGGTPGEAYRMWKSWSARPRGDSCETE